MELKAGESILKYNPADQTVTMEGSMRLANLMEYDKISVFLNDAATQASDKLTLDMTKLNFLNSSGITTLSMFILATKKKQNPKLNILGTALFAWQEKSLKNFNKLWNEVEISIQ